MVHIVYADGTLRCRFLSKEGKKSKGLNDFDLKAKAKMYYMCHIPSKASTRLPPRCAQIIFCSQVDEFGPRTNRVNSRIARERCLTLVGQTSLSQHAGYAVHPRQTLKLDQTAAERAMYREKERPSRVSGFEMRMVARVSGFG